MPTAAGLNYREEGPEDGRVLLCVHGVPESSHTWRDVLPAAAAAGWRAIAPDLPGYGDSPPEPPSTWARQVAALDRFRRELGLDTVVLAVRDWGGLIGLRWACENPDAIAGLVISSSGFFPDGKWHGMAKVMRTPGDGEAMMAAIDRPGFDGMMRSLSPTITDAALDEHWKAYADDERRQGQLELYRSGNFEELAVHDGKLAAMAVPTLLLWSESDPFAPVAGAHRFKREIPHAELVILDGCGHFMNEDDGPAVAQEITAFLESV